MKKETNLKVQMTIFYQKENIRDERKFNISMTIREFNKWRDTCKLTSIKGDLLLTGILIEKK